MKQFKVLASNLVYQMLRTKPQGVATLANAEERMFNSLVVDHLSERNYVKQGPNTFCIDGKLIQLPIDYHVSETWYYTGVAELLSAPEQYNPSKGESHEIEFTLPDFQEKVVRSLASKLGANYDNNFVASWMIGNAICQWYSTEDEIVVRSTESLLPVGEYEFSVLAYNYVEQHMIPKPDVIEFESNEGGWLRFNQEDLVNDWVRKLSIKVLVTNSKSSDSLSKESFGKKSKGVKDKLSNTNQQSVPAQMGR